VHTIGCIKILGEHVTAGLIPICFSIRPSFYFQCNNLKPRVELAEL